MSFLNGVTADNQIFLFALIGMGIIIFIMLFFMITMKMDISNMQNRYKKMMVGSEGENLELLLTRNTNEIVRFSEEQQKLSDNVRRIEKILERAITKVAMMRFNAFENTGSDLSFCIALLDDNNSGVIISSINGREEARTYAKPIVNGSPSQYKLTKEEEHVLREASEVRH